MDNNKLQEFFEREGFNVHLFDEQDDGVICAEIEKWTDGGVDMIILLRPFIAKKFIEYVDEFDIDDEIDAHRIDPEYKSDFTIREALKDFTGFHIRLKQIVSKLNKMKGGKDGNTGSTTTST